MQTRWTHSRLKFDTTGQKQIHCFTMFVTKNTKSFLSVTCPLPVQSHYGVSFSQSKPIWGIFAISFITCRCLQTQLSWPFVFWTAPSSVSVAKTMRTITVHVLSSVVQGRTGVCMFGRPRGWGEGRGDAGIRIYIYIIIFKPNEMFSFVSFVDSFRRKWKSFKGISCKDCPVHSV